MTPSAHTVTIPWPGTAGLRLHVEESGAGERAFLLLHGFTFNTSTWHDVFPGFAALAQLFAVMDAVGLERAVLVGSSAGGLLAARAALAEPARVAGLVLVCGAILSGPSSRGAGLLRLPFPGRAIARRVGNNGWLLKRSFHDAARITPERFANARMHTTVPGWDRALWEFMKASTAQPDISGELGRIRQPVLVVGGTGDRVVPPADCRRLANLLPRAELAMIGDAGHVPHEEQPAKFMVTVSDWVKRNV